MEDKNSRVTLWVVTIIAVAIMSYAVFLSRNRAKDVVSDYRLRSSNILQEHFGEVSREARA